MLFTSHLKCRNIDAKHRKEKVQIPYVPPPRAIVAHERFYRFISSMDNFVALLDTDIYNSTSKKVSQRVVKKFKVKKDLEEEVIEKCVLIGNTSIDHVFTTIVNRELGEANKDRFHVLENSSKLHGYRETQIGIRAIIEESYHPCYQHHIIRQLPRMCLSNKRRSPISVIKILYKGGRLPALLHQI